ncbi:MAG: DUF1080 domain-containing protein, partial [Planctomycetes bacterium]|nr:DUF1080 domain-containing protein [Planctomycetota bacterium]
LHLEFATPEEVKGKGQGRGNSGVYLMDRYEVQILDSYENATYYDGQCGAIYKQQPPMVNASRKPGEWQMYDILFTAPRFSEEGEVEQPAYVTVLHNGVVIHNHFEIQGSTSYTEPPKYHQHPEKAPFSIQFHGNPVRFRNIWVRESIQPLVGEKPEEKTGQDRPEEKESETSARELSGPLSQYVAKEDASYRWTEHRQGQVGATAYVELRLVSQTWRGVPWKHQLFLLKPSTVADDAHHGLLFIGGGRWRPELDDPDHEQRLPSEAPLLAAVAEQLRSPVAILLQVPHQPILGGRYEDDAIAHTFEQFLRTGEQDWPLLLPMVKSAVRAMDAAEEYAKEKWSLDVKSFTVTGASKRGWTTWLTGAVDRRATAIAPMVIDMLNMGPQMKHQVASFGAYSQEIEDYTQRGLQKHLASEDGQALVRIVDPYAYRRILTQPKLLLLGTNDRYWPLDAANLYWDGLEGEKHVLYIPNNGHGLRDYPRIIGALTALHRQAAGGEALPKLTWKFENSKNRLRLHVACDEKPKSVQIWLATSPTRDFRDSQWTSRPAQANGEGYMHDLPLPETGYAAMFGEAVFDNGDAPSLHLSTNVRIVNFEAVDSE